MKRGMLSRKHYIFLFGILVLFGIGTFIATLPLNVKGDSTIKVRVGYAIETGYQEGKQDEPKSGYGYEYYQKISYYTGWEYEYIYGTYDELLEMLKDGQIDIMGNLVYEKSLEKDILFSKREESRDRYFGVSKDRVDLYEGLNLALEEIQTNNPHYNDEVYVKYHKTSLDADLNLTKEDEEWLEKQNKITVGYVVQKLPYTDQSSDGSMTGFFVDIFNYLEDIYDIEFVKKGYESHEDMYQALQAGKIDVITPAFADYWIAEKLQMMLLDFSLSSSMMMIYKGNYDESLIQTVAVTVANPFQEYYIQTHYPDSEIVYCMDSAACIRALEEDAATCTVMIDSGYQFYREINEDIKKYNVSILPYSVKVGIATRKDNIHLMNVLNSGIASIDEALINQALVKNSSVEKKRTFRTYLRENAGFVILNLTFAFFLIGSLVFWNSIQLKKNNRQLLNAKETAEKLKQEAQEAEKRAISENLAKTEFLSQTSRDIRNPLHSIIGLIDIADKNMGDWDKVQECHDKIHVSANQILAVLDEVFNMSRLEDDSLELVEESFQLVQLIQSCIQHIKDAANEKQIRIRFTEPEEKIPYLLGSPVHLRQIISNLLSNAIKYNKDNGNIICTLEKVKQIPEENKVYYKLIIADSGIGMEEEFQKHIFEPYSQEKRVEDTYGNGLGLALVKKLVDRLGGEISFQSIKEIGTSFSIIFPFSIEPNPISEEEKEQTLANLKVLLVESDEMSMEATAQMLETEKIQVKRAHNGEEAIEAFMNSEPDEFALILMDISMPNQNGFVTGRKIRMMDRSDAKVIPIVAMSVSFYDEEIKLALKAGMNKHLIKPIEKSALLEMVMLHTRMRKRNEIILLNEEKEKQMKLLQFQAQHDTFTGLFTKKSFFENVSAVLKMQRDKMHAMMVIDMDNFKHINDNYGHDVGDEIILGVAEILKTHFRSGDLLGRFGGDEFIVFMTGVQDFSVVEKKAGEIMSEVSRKFSEKYSKVTFSASVGISFEPGTVDVHDMFKHADQALYLAKNYGKQQYQVYQKELNAFRSDKS